MTSTLVALLPAAIGFALSPIGLVEMILVLMSRRARTNGIVFLVAIVVPVFVVPLLGATLFDTAESQESTRSATQGWVLIVIAALLFIMAVRNFATRHDASVPAVFEKVQNMGPGAVIVLSGGVTIANPKNLLVLLGAGSIAAEQGLSGAELVAAVAVFTIVATSPFILAVGYAVFGGDAAAQTLSRLKDALLRRNRLIMAVVLAILGLALLAKGLSAFA